jgi:hypothetical protein
MKWLKTSAHTKNLFTTLMNLVPKEKLKCL